MVLQYYCFSTWNFVCVFINFGTYFINIQLKFVMVDYFTFLIFIACSGNAFCTTCMSDQMRFNS